MRKTLSELEEEIRVLTEENKELKDNLYKYWLEYGPIEAESYVSYERTDYPNDGRG